MTGFTKNIRKIFSANNNSFSSRLLTRPLSLVIIIFTLSTCSSNKDPGPVDIIREGQIPDGTVICVAGDGGNGSDVQYMVAQAMYENGCDQIRIPGDVIYETGITSADDPMFEENFLKPHAVLLENDIPIYVTMGNHDHLGKIKPWREIDAEYELIHFPNHYYAELWGDVCFISADTNKFMIGQTKWLGEVYDELKEDCKLSLAFAHHPLKSVGKHGDASLPVKLFLEKSITGKLDAYFAGHDHNLSYEGAVDDTLLFVSGAAGKRRDLKKEPEPGNFAKSAQGYMAVTINRANDSVWASYEFIEVKDGVSSSIYEGTIPGRGIRD